ncbi:hypothetical protein EJF18_80240 [Clavispora lusitaniae]|uniref:Uncharacterized protein n=1 Tax=Clavispora lusitaniae TaxID=36911 RepID=A0ACD0WSY0_CLALS|nr:hypothetical protein EJF14_80240 [Clavispora lusitaniae]QFZ36183.1 hypothetical protein EJF16_80240 [Clavispora lusitaniae]QFZ41867.1 hypothetical protein EJF15_80240 [Clavispora lusitaniae]QFZ47543.1 hypothetical protein EJF18_80240 [Clavispora lusitaniae]QFZ53222.1 hypothetical protein EJF17_80240 [Clavispora lusitaniae]
MPRRKTRQTRPHCPSQTGIVGLRHGWPRAGCRGHEISQWENIAGGKTDYVVGNGEGTGLAFWLFVSFCSVCSVCSVFSFSCVQVLVFSCSGSRFLVFRCSGQVFRFSLFLLLSSFLLPSPDAPTQSCSPTCHPLFMPALRWWAGADISGVEGASAAGRGAGAGKKPFRLAANKAMAHEETGQKILPNSIA